MLFSDILLKDYFVHLNFEDIFTKLSGRHQWRLPPNNLILTLSTVSCLSELSRWKICLSLYLLSSTGYFIRVYRSLQVQVPRIILKYLSILKLPQKRSHQSIYISNSHKKIFIFCINHNICNCILENIFESFYKYNFECT